MRPLALFNWTVDSNPPWLIELLIQIQHCFQTFWCHFGGVDFFIFCEFLQLEHDFGHSDVSFYVCVFIFATIQQPLALFDDFYVCIFSFLLLYSSLSHFFDADLGDFEGANPRTDTQTHRQTDTHTCRLDTHWMDFLCFIRVYVHDFIRSFRG